METNDTTNRHEPASLHSAGGDNHDADALLAVLIERGAGQYGYEPVTQLEHALQSAMLAEQAGEQAELIIAALFHDIGHLLDDADVTQLERGRDDRHEMRGAAVLKQCFGSEVSGPVALHVAAKRFLCTTQPMYLEQLSDASRASLAVQGGLMNQAEMERFSASRYAGAAIRLRRYDDTAKLHGCQTPQPQYFARYWKTCASTTASVPGRGFVGF